MMSSWNRVATMPMHQTLFSAIARSQERLADVQQQMTTGKKAPTYAALGTEAVRLLSTHTMMAKQEAQGAVAARVGTTLSLMDAQISGIEDSMMSLRRTLLDAVGTGTTTGVQEAAEEAFSHFRSALNADEGGAPLFAGSQTAQPPFAPANLAAAAGVPTPSAFTNDDLKAGARIADGVDVAYGITASELGGELFDAFRTLAEAGAFGDKPNPTQKTALNTAIGQIDSGLASLRKLNAENGRRQAQIETLASRAEGRTLVLRKLIEANEDADMAEVASEIVQRQTTLQASYTMFSRLSSLSLVNFLR